MESERARTPIFLAVLILSILITGCGGAPQAQIGEPTRLRTCYTSLTATQIPLLYAYEQGFFEQEGLELELSYFQSGTEAATAMIAGELDICQIAGSSVVNAAVAGEDLFFLAGLFNTYVYSLLVRPDITEPQHLVGESIAVSRVGSSSDAAARIALRSMGLEPDDDVAIVAIGDQSARVAALEAGQVGGTIASIPDSTRARQSGFPVLLDMSTLNAPFQHTAIAATGQLLSEQRPAAVAFMRALVAAIRSMKSDRQGTIDVMAQYLQLDPETDAELLAAAYDDLVPLYLPDEPYPSLEGIQTLLDQLEAENPAAAQFEPADLVDRTVLEEALEDIGG